MESLFSPTLLFIPTLGPMELIVLLVIILILFGPGKLPEVFGALGNGVKQFKKASNTVTEELNNQLTDLTKESDDNTETAKSNDATATTNTEPVDAPKQ